uniref:Solute carrier family 35 member D3 n=1 Tax=Petromyzon marinus TaxID=7757 RepID=A0AAJ7U2I9_PETMA|nr:solute carrier family 35 member D3 [Petromyzon marinus]
MAFECVRGRRARGVLTAVAHGLTSASLNLLLKVLLSTLRFPYLTLLQLSSSLLSALTLESLRRCGLVTLPPFGASPARAFAPVTLLSVLHSTLTLLSLRGLSLPTYVVFKRCLPLVTLALGAALLRGGRPTLGVVASVVVTTAGAVLAGIGDVTSDPVAYATGVLAVLVHGVFLVLIQRTCTDNLGGPLAAQYAISISASPLLLAYSLASQEAIHVWAFPGWHDGAVVAAFLGSAALAALLGLTTVACTAFNSAVTTSFVGVVKSVLTISVGMLVLRDPAAEPPSVLFLSGLALNTVGSIFYCVAKYWETRERRDYDELEEAPLSMALSPQGAGGGQEEDGSGGSGGGGKHVTEGQAGVAMEWPSGDKVDDGGGGGGGESAGAGVADDSGGGGGGAAARDDGAEQNMSRFLAVWRLLKVKRFQNHETLK